MRLHGSQKGSCPAGEGGGSLSRPKQTPLRGSSWAQPADPADLRAPASSTRGRVFSLAWHSRVALLVWQVTFGSGWPLSSPEAGEASLALPAPSPTLFPGMGRKRQGCPGAELPGGPKRGRAKREGGPRQPPSCLLARHKSRRSYKQRVLWAKEDLASAQESASAWEKTAAAAPGLSGCQNPCPPAQRVCNAQRPGQEGAELPTLPAGEASVTLRLLPAAPSPAQAPLASCVVTAPWRLLLLLLLASSAWASERPSPCQELRMLPPALGTRTAPEAPASLVPPLWERQRKRAASGLSLCPDGGSSFAEGRRRVCGGHSGEGEERGTHSHVAPFGGLGARLETETQLVFLSLFFTDRIFHKAAKQASVKGPPGEANPTQAGFPLSHDWHEEDFTGQDSAQPLQMSV